MTNEREIAVREKRPSMGKGGLFVLLVTVIMAVLLMLALTRRSEEGPFVPTKEPVAISVTVETVSLESALALEETFSGMVQARRTSQLGFSGSGRIAAIAVDVGDRVREGQLLAHLDVRDLNAQLRSAEANIMEAKANHTLALATVERQQHLFERGHVSQQRVDEVVAQASAASARIDAARAQAETLQVTIDLSHIRAPFSGTITTRMSDEGVIAVPGAPLLELVEADHLEARIGLPASVAAEMEVGGDYILVSQRGLIEATLRADTGIVDQSLRTVTSIFDIADTQAISAGEIVRLALERDIEERGFWVPVSALTESSRGLWSLYVVEEDADGGWSVQPRLVETVHSEGTRVFVRGTVRNGERYVTDGLSRLVPGQRVRPVGPPSAYRAE